MDTSDENLATRHLKLGILFVVRAKNLLFKKEWKKEGMNEWMNERKKKDRKEGRKKERKNWERKKERKEGRKKGERKGKNEVIALLVFAHQHRNINYTSWNIREELHLLKCSNVPD